MEKIAVIVVVALAWRRPLICSAETSPPATFDTFRRRHDRRRAGRCRRGHGLEARPYDDNRGWSTTPLVEAHLPLVGLVLADVPDAETRLRASLREELRNPTTQGAPRPLVLVSELRTAHIVPLARDRRRRRRGCAGRAYRLPMRHLRGTTSPPVASWR